MLTGLVVMDTDRTLQTRDDKYEMNTYDLWLSYEQ